MFVPPRCGTLQTGILTCRLPFKGEMVSITPRKGVSVSGRPVRVPSLTRCAAANIVKSKKATVAVTVSGWRLITSFSKTKVSLAQDSWEITRGWRFTRPASRLNLHAFIFLPPRDPRRLAGNWGHLSLGLSLLLLEDTRTTHAN